MQVLVVEGEQLIFVSVDVIDVVEESKRRGILMVMVVVVVEER